MLKRLHQASSYAIIALGIVHTSLTPLLICGFTAEALWFASAGLAMILIGFLNTALRNDDGQNRPLRLLCHAANLLLTLFGVSAVMVVAEPQAYFGLLALVVQTLTAFALTGTATKRAAEY